MRLALKYGRRVGLCTCISSCTRRSDDFHAQSSRTNQVTLRLASKAVNSVHVVGLVLPIVDMPEAIEKVLITGMCVLSEKPFSPDPTVAARLWQRYTALDASRSVT